MIDLTQLTTETRNPRTTDLDEWSALEIITEMNREDLDVVDAVRKELPRIACLAEVCTQALKKGGRIVYIGAGTSGRLGVLDAVECPPTFGVSDNCVVGLIAGGAGAYVKAVEGAEDSLTLAEKDLRKIALTADDVVIGLAASGRTPFVIGGLRYAKSIGCSTGSVVCNGNAAVSAESDYPVEVVSGPEVLTGSTRLKAGTAKKMVLNMISTASMVGVGKAYQNLMVDVVQSNEKLVTRAENIVIAAAGCDRDTAAEKLTEAEGSAKLAITSLLLGLDTETAADKLAQADGHVRKAVVTAQGSAEVKEA